MLVLVVPLRANVVEGAVWPEIGRTKQNARSIIRHRVACVEAMTA